MSHRRWSEVRDKHIDAAGAENVEAGKNHMLAQVRTSTRRGPQAACMTQHDVAVEMTVICITDTD